MMNLLLTLLTALPVPAKDLRARLERPACDVFLSEITDSNAQRNLTHRIFERAGRVFDGPGEVYVAVDDVADLEPADVMHRERNIQRALIEMSLALPDQFASKPLGHLEWRLGVYKMGEDRPRREAMLVGDHLTFDPDRLHLTGGEFLVEIPYDEDVTADELVELTRWAFERTRLPSSRLKGIRSPSFRLGYGTLYVLLDLIGEPEYRLQETLRLMKYVNEELMQVD